MNEIKGKNWMKLNYNERIIKKENEINEKNWMKLNDNERMIMKKLIKMKLMKVIEIEWNLMIMK